MTKSFHPFRNKTFHQESGFSLLELLILISLVSLLIMGFGSSMIKNLQARKAVSSKLGYDEVSTSLRSTVSQILRDLPASGCLNFAKIQQSTASSNLLAVNTRMGEGLAPQQQELLAQPRNAFARAAVQRCNQNHDIADPSSAADNALFFCARFKNSNNSIDSSLLASPHAFGEYRFEWIDAFTEQPISCDAFRTSKQAAVHVYYTFYWANGQSGDASYSKHSGYYYVGK